MSIRQFIKFSLTLALAFYAVASNAQQNSNKAIRIIVGFSPGGASDTIARLYASKLQDVLKTPVIVENKPGAYELIAAQTFISAPADGYAIWQVTSGSIFAIPAIRKGLPYEPMKSLSLLGRVGDIDAVYVTRKGLPFESLDDLVAYAKKNPGKLNYGSGGMGSISHLMTEQLKMLNGIEMSHVPYKSDGEVLQALLSGSLDFAMITVPVALPYLQTENIKGIGVTGASRIPELPALRFAAESSTPEIKKMLNGPYSIYGYVVHANTPPAMAEKLSSAIAKVAAMPEVKEKLQAMQTRSNFLPPIEFKSYVERETPVWQDLGRRLDLKM